MSSRDIKYLKRLLHAYQAMRRNMFDTVDCLELKFAINRFHEKCITKKIKEEL